MVPHFSVSKGPFQPYLMENDPLERGNKISQYININESNESLTFMDGISGSLSKTQLSGPSNVTLEYTLNKI